MTEAVALATGVSANAATPADVMEPMFEMPAEHVVLRKSLWVCPDCSEPSDQSCDPVGGLYGLVAMTFNVKRRFD